MFIQDVAQLIGVEELKSGRAVAGSLGRLPFKMSHAISAVAFPHMVVSAAGVVSQSP